ncbi:MAG: 2-oxo-4-hydroxy-4-carboxy-5-ureidoimidazoline decarboxylase [Acidobacteriota bacterium]|nr:2-oxo-4-hydroxy-4-carboxy-5-ureidoimidazoline decarboxylase [Acidobacteriota bacterium]
MSEKLKQLNQAAKEMANADFLNCCGSQTWARLMTEARPFADIAELIKQAAQIWQNLDAQDWLEAFAAHPKIGARKAVSHQSAQSAEWSNAEQSGTQTAADSLRTELERANRLYEEKFGFIFIVCATGKSAEEMLDLCRLRVHNDADSEIRFAADEQRKITEIRLKKLLNTEIK